MRAPSFLALVLLSGGGLSARDFTRHPRPGVNLLALVQPRHDAVRGTWELIGRGLECTEATNAARILVPYLPPEEYTLLVEAERTEGQDAFIVGLASGDHQFVHMLDGYTDVGKCLSGFEILDGKQADVNESMRPGKAFYEGRRTTVLYTVRKGRVTIRANGETVLDWEGDFKRLSVRPDYRVTNPGTLFVGAWKSKFRITRMTLYPISAGGRRLRD
jgi:hypothetical protein